VALETHGRWPVAGAAALIPVSAASARKPALRPLAALLWHQTEEWVWPGGFLPWINHEILGSDEDEFPIDRPAGFVINVVFGWGFSAAAAAGAQAAAPAALLYTTHLGNAALHLVWAVRHRRYDPGTVTSVLTLLPVAVVGLRRLHADPAVSSRDFRAGVVGGVAVSAGLVVGMRLRLRRRRRQRRRR
jgi:hypothetical protein